MHICLLSFKIVRDTRQCKRRQHFLPPCFTCLCRQVNRPPTQQFAELLSPPFSTRGAAVLRRKQRRVKSGRP